MVLGFNDSDDDEVRITGSPSPVLGQPPIGSGPGPGTSVPDDDDDDGQSLADRYEEYYDSRRARRTLPDWIDRFDGGGTDGSGGSNDDGDGGAFPGFFGQLPGGGNNPVGQFLRGVGSSVDNQFDQERGGGFADMAGGEFLGDVLFERPEGVDDDVNLPGPGIGAGLLGRLNAWTPGGPPAEDATGTDVRTDGAGFAPFAGEGSIQAFVGVAVILAVVLAVGQLFNINVG